MPQQSPQPQPPLVETDLPLPGRRRGKVRDIYSLPPGPEFPAGRTLLIATDRLSAFDVVLPTPIPGKGRMLTQLSNAWFALIRSWGLVDVHAVSSDARDIPGLSEIERSALDGRVTIGRACHVVPIEFVARGYIEGSGWADYLESGRICGIELPVGLRRGDPLPTALFTPATKADQGEHDENITEDQAAARIGGRLLAHLKSITLEMYARAHAHARERGVILADTKFEFGVPKRSADEEAPASAEEWSEALASAMLIDEALTPDSSRYWPAEAWTPGAAQESFDKQFVRGYLQRLVDAGAWDKAAPGPALPDGVVRGTVERYREAYERLFGGS